MRLSSAMGKSEGYTDFRTTYGKSVVVLNGSFSNLFNYIVRNGPLKGDVHL
jgi:hypothetical protein